MTNRTTPARTPRITPNQLKALREIERSEYQQADGYWITLRLAPIWHRAADALVKKGLARVEPSLTGGAYTITREGRVALDRAITGRVAS